MTGYQLRLWRKNLDLRQDQAAHALGLTTRGYQNFEYLGKRRVPRWMQLAVLGLNYLMSSVKP